MGEKKPPMTTTDTTRKFRGKWFRLAWESVDGGDQGDSKRHSVDIILDRNVGLKGGLFSEEYASASEILETANDKFVGRLHSRMFCWTLSRQA